MKKEKENQKSKQKMYRYEEESAKILSENDKDRESSHKKKNVTESEKSKKNPTNKQIMLVTYIFIGLFIFMLGYFAKFIISDSSEVINNAYNKRQDLLAETIIRGDIISADGKVLAHTVTDEDGIETRVYPYENMFVHVVGRFLKGHTGIESTENLHLLTSNNNTLSKIVKELSGEKNIGDNVITTLDTRLQQTAYEALGNRKGAIVVIEPSSGKILAMVSKPDYDPGKIDDAWDELVIDSENNSALVNRATQGLYPPGSTFKILTALEYIRENPTTYQEYIYNCKGYGIFNSVKIKCYNYHSHGEEDLKKSFAKSCNASFASIGTTLDMKAFRNLCQDFLFNSPLPTNLVYNQSKFVLSENSNKNQIPQTVIGQGDTQITPLHNALIVSAIANGGVLMKPYVIDRIENQGRTTIKKYMPEIYGSLITPDEAQILTSFMTETVENGTARALKNNKYTIAGKTGSAEYKQGEPAHAWFVGFSPTAKPEIVVSIIVESVGSGSEYAVPIASKIFKAYYNNK